MHFLPDVYVPCETCGEKRYNRETLEVRFKGKSIADVLDMTVEEAAELFKAVPAVRDKLLTLARVGLGYIHVGQQAHPRPVVEPFPLCARAGAEAVPVLGRHGRSKRGGGMLTQAALQHGPQLLVAPHPDHTAHHRQGHIGAGLF